LDHGGLVSTGGLLMLMGRRRLTLGPEKVSGPEILGGSGRGSDHLLDGVQSIPLDGKNLLDLE